MPSPSLSSALLRLWACSLLVSSAGCRDPEASVPTEPEPEILHGEPCDQPATIGYEEGCSQCVCSEDGVWDCFRLSCGSVALVEPRAQLMVVVDDSSSMGPDRQARLAYGLQQFAAAFDAHPDPVQLRIGITTTDHGNLVCDPATNDEGALLVRSCAEHLDDFAAPTDGALAEAPIPDDAAERGCTSICDVPQLRTIPSAVADDPQLRPRPWLERWGDTTNLEGDPSFDRALACAIPQGVRGCDFESPLEAARSALMRAQDPDDPAWGFMGQTGPLSLLVVSDESDCSAQDEWVTVFDPEGTRRFWTDPEAELPTSAVCWNTGVRCSGGPGVYDGCEAINIDTAEHVDVHNDNAVLVPIDHIVRDIDDARSSRTEAFDGQFRLASLTAVPVDGGPIEYTDGQDDPAFALQYGVGPGCTSADGSEVAVPSPRTLAVQDRFWSGEHVDSICADDYGPALVSLAEAMLEDLQWSQGCYWTCAADVDPDTAALDPDCRVIEQWQEPDGSRSEGFVSPCEGEVPPAGEDLCYIARTDEALSPWCAERGHNLELALRRDRSVAPRLGSYVTAVCRDAEDPDSACPGLL